jgi:hypothetical protein
MKLDTLNELVDNSELGQLQKNITKGFLARANDYELERAEKRDLIEKIYGNVAIDEIVLATDEVIIFKTLFRKRDGHEWDTKYPFRSILLKNGKWERNSTVSPSLDTAFLCYLEGKYLGGNSNFTEFAMKMLEIKIEG